MSDDSVLTQSHRDNKPVNGKSVLTRSVDGRPAVTDRDKPVNGKSVLTRSVDGRPAVTDRDNTVNGKSVLIRW